MLGRIEIIQDVRDEEGDGNHQEFQIENNDGPDGLESDNQPMDVDNYDQRSNQSKSSSSGHYFCHLAELAERVETMQPAEVSDQTDFVRKAHANERLYHPVLTGMWGKLMFRLLNSLLHFRVEVRYPWQFCFIRYPSKCGTTTILATVPQSSRV